MSSTPKFPQEKPGQPPLVAVDRFPNRPFIEPGKYIAAGTPEEDDPANLARIAAADAGGIPQHLIEVSLGLRNPYVGEDVPFAPTPEFRPRPIGNVGSEPGVLSGKDLTRIKTENTPVDPNAVSLSAVRAKYFPGSVAVKGVVQTETAKPKLSEANAKNRFELLELHRTHRLPFVPSTEDELELLAGMLPEDTTAARLDPTLGSKYIDTARLLMHEMTKTEGLSGAVVQKMVGAIEKDLLHEWADFIEDARGAQSSLVVLRNVLSAGKYGDRPLEKLLLDVFSKDDKELQAVIMRGIVALIQYRDIKRLRDDAVEPPFNPLDTVGSSKRQRAGSNMRIANRYGEVRVLDSSDEMLDYVLAEAFEFNLIDSVLMIDGAIANQATRGKFWNAQLSARIRWVFPLLGVLDSTKKVQ